MPNNYAKGRLDPNVSFQVIRADPRLLQLLDGRIQLKPGTQLYLVHSEIYVLPRPGDTEIQPLSEDFLLDPESYDTARSVHLAATYYALSLDAAQRSCQPQHAIYLSRAAEILQDIHSRGAGVAKLAALILAEQRALAHSP
jgi:hypothetical protein